MSNTPDPSAGDEPNDARWAPPGVVLPPQSSTYTSAIRVGARTGPASTVGPTTPRSLRKPLWLVAAIAIAALAAVAVLSMLYIAVANDRDDVEQALSESESDLTESEAQVAQYRKGAADFLAVAIGTEVEVTEGDATCMAEALVESLGPEVLGMLASDESTDSVMKLGIEMMTVALVCDVPLDTFQGEPGFSYGDNPTLDALHDECAEGVGASCDALYRNSDVGTRYETFGGTCGNRFEPGDAPLSCEGNI